jgi:small subunit ribosomal protein S19
MARKTVTYRGKTLEELKKMSIKEFGDMLPARQRRTLQRGFTDYQKRLIERIKKVKEGKSKKAIKTHCRSMMILPDMVGMNLLVHDGKGFVALAILEEMLGHYLGEFVLTRKKVSHSSPGIGATRSSASISVK